MKVGISHAAFAPERKRTLDRLLNQLSIETDAYVAVSIEREPCRVWTNRIWEWAASVDDDVMLLNDDITVAPNLVDDVKTTLDLLPDDVEILGLHFAESVGVSLLHAGERYVRCWGVSGPAYVLRQGVAKKLLAYSRDLGVHSMGSDTILSLFAWSRRCVPWTMLPAPTAHDDHVASTFDDGRGEQVRTSPVAWTKWPHLTPIGIAKEEPILVEASWLSSRTLAAYERELSYGIPIGMCWHCRKRHGVCGSPQSAMAVCLECARAFGALAQAYDAKQENDHAKR